MNASRKEILEVLCEQGTLRLIAISILTLGVYLAHYVQRQSVKLNGFLELNDKISKELYLYILALSYLNFVLLLFIFFYGRGEVVNTIGSLVETALSGLILIWVFEARNKVIRLLNLQPNLNVNHWFHGGWTLCFNVFYYNLKLNDFESEFTKHLGDET